MFAMISLGVGELIAACSIIIVVFFGGEEGISGDRTMGPEVFGFDFASQQEVYYLTVTWLMAAAVGMFLRIASRSLPVFTILHCAVGRSPTRISKNVRPRA